MVRLISMDLHGTLLDSNRMLQKENKTALEKAAKSGAMLVVSTGSPWKLVPHEILSELSISYIITANGSAIYDYRKKECIYEDCIMNDEILPVLEFLLSMDMHMDVCIQGNAYCARRALNVIPKLKVPKARKEYIAGNRIWVDDLYELVKVNAYNVQKITMNFYPDETGKMVDKDKIVTYLSNHKSVKVVSAGWENLEITQQNVDKGKALQHLCKEVGIPLNQTMAIGDSLNDLDIIKTAGIGVAMKNAMPEVLELADYVTNTNDACGVAEAVYRGINFEGSKMR